MKSAMRPKLIALCVQTHSLEDLLLGADTNVSDGRFGGVCVLLYAHAALNNSA